MAKKRAKCVLCGRNLKGNEWKWYVDADGVERYEKVCINERACKNRQKKQKEVYEVPQEAKELEEKGVATSVKPVADVKTTNIGNYTRRYLEVLLAVFVLVASIAIFCFVNKGGF